MPTTTFADRLRQIMSERGLKQADLVHMASSRGEKLGKSQVSQYVSGKVVPRANVVRLLAALLGVDASWLASGEAPSSATGDGPASATSAARAAARPETAPTAPTAPVPTIKRSATMREFKKSSKLDNVLYDVRGPVADEAARMEDEGLRILKLNIGNPAPFGFRAPDEVVHDMRHQLTDCEGYSDSRGLFSARKAIMQYAQLKRLPNVSMDGVYTGNGVSELIQLCMNVLLNTGDEILIPSPDYPLWTACATLAGGTAVHYLCDEQAEWCPDLADMESKITSNTKAIVIINPNNPTGLPARGARADRGDRAAPPADDLLGRDLRPPVHGWLPAHIHRLARARPAVRHLLRPLQEPHGRGLSHRLDDSLGQQALHARLHLRHQHALQHASVLQRAGAVHRADACVCAPTCRRSPSCRRRSAATRAWSAT